MRRALRVLGTTMLAGGVGMLLWGLAVWLWQDPFTALFTAYQQERLESRYDARLASYRPLRRVVAAHPAPSPASGGRRGRPARRAPLLRDALAREAARYRSSLGVGDPVGRLEVPRLGLNAIVVNGTDARTLTKGPGRYAGSYVPGEGELVYIAGHRTTYGAPFADIDRLRPGDTVTLEVPYGTFVYRVRNSVVVDAHDLDRLRSRGREVVALQACHPRFFASQRYIAYATPVRVVLSDGRAYPLAA